MTEPRPGPYLLREPPAQRGLEPRVHIIETAITHHDQAIARLDVASRNSDDRLRIIANRGRRQRFERATDIP